MDYSGKKYNTRMDVVPEAEGTKVEWAKIPDKVEKWLETHPNITNIATAAVGMSVRKRRYNSYRK